jgi:hypothetical protein
MIWYNTETHVMQTTNPAGGWRSAEYMAQNYPEWKQVEDDFEPPAVEHVPTKEEKLAALDKGYEAQRKELTDYFVQAMLSGDTELQEEMRTTLAELNEEYDSQRKEIEKE